MLDRKQILSSSLISIPSLGNVSIRGRILRGIVASTKMKRTITVCLVCDPYIIFRSSYGYDHNHNIILIIIFFCLIISIQVRRDYLHFISKYNRFEKRHSMTSAHCSPAFTIKEGDVVTVGQCRYIFTLLFVFLSYWEISLLVFFSSFSYGVF